MTAHDLEPSRPPRGEPGCPPRGVACAGHVFAAHVRADPGLVWAALTDPDQTARVTCRAAGSMPASSPCRNSMPCRRLAARTG